MRNSATTHSPRHLWRLRAQELALGIQIVREHVSCKDSKEEGKARHVTTKKSSNNYAEELRLVTLTCKNDQKICMSPFGHLHFATNASQGAGGARCA